MNASIALNLGALLSLVPAAGLAFRRRGAPDALFYGVLGLAVLGPAFWVGAQVGPWHTGFAMSLWVTIAATMALFLALAATTGHAWQLAPLLVPYLLLLALAALVWAHAPERPISPAVPSGWLDAHIVLAVVTYALLTVAAVAGLAVFLQERALKAKRPKRLTRLLPSVAESETLELRLLAAAEAVLAFGIISGMANEYFLAGRFLHIDHKTLFSIGAFAVIGALLLGRRIAGLRGKRVARLALLAYLLLTLAYPGVKFVTDVLMS